MWKIPTSHKCLLTNTSLLRDKLFFYCQIRYISTTLMANVTLKIKYNKSIKLI